MFRTRWFGHITGVTPAFLIKEDLIVRVALNSAFQVGLGHLFAQAARISKTGRVVAPVAGEHARPGNNLVILGYVRIGYVLKPVNYVAIVPTNSRGQVKELNQRICLEAKPALEAFNGPNCPLAAQTPETRLKYPRYVFVENAFYLRLDARALRINEDKAVDEADQSQRCRHPKKYTHGLDSSF